MKPKRSRSQGTGRPHRDRVVAVRRPDVDDRDRQIIDELNEQALDVLGFRIEAGTVE